MPRRSTLACAALALTMLAGTVHAQRASVAIGAVVPSGDYSTTAGTGFEIQLQARTEPMFGPIALRIDIGYEHFAGRDSTGANTTFSQSISFLGDFGSRFYWLAGPGYYQKGTPVTIDGHTGTRNFSYFGAQGAVGVNFQVLRWDGFLEAGAVKLFAPGPTIAWVPLRFGIRL